MQEQPVDWFATTAIRAAPAFISLRMPRNLRTWPDYQYNLDRAKPNKTGTGPDLSGVDFVWCMTCSTWGFEEKDIIDRLLEVSEHARLPDNGRPYAERTAKNAARYIERSRQQKRERIARHERG